VHAAITGLCAAHRDDEARLAAGSVLFDSYYAFFSIQARSASPSGTS
jgi:hypothetical protein